MFKYNPGNFTIEDNERGLIVTQVPGGGPSSFVGKMASGTWSFEFLVERESNRSRYLDGKFITNPEYSIKLQVTTYPVIGEFEGDSNPSDLAREAAIALETGFYQSDAAKIQIN